MINKILIFGLGFQGKKYISYFRDKGYIIDGVSLSGYNKNNILGLNSIFSYNNFIDIDLSKTKYDLIIICVSPFYELEKVINYFLENKYSGKILIEKPISYNINFLEKLIYKENIYFFIDDIILSPIYKKINILNVSVFSNEQINILEHILGGFLLCRDFKFILKNTTIKSYGINNSDLIYILVINSNITLSFYKGLIKLNNNYIMEVAFGKCLEFILGFNTNDNLLYKKNFIYLREYLNNYKTCK